MEEAEKKKMNGVGAMSVINSYRNMFFLHYVVFFFFFLIIAMSVVLTSLF